MERLSVDRLRADEKLIEGVKRYPCLWEIHNKSFRDLAAKESAWKIVAQEVGYSDEDCLKRWKSLRDRFVREAKKVKENATPDGGSGYVPPWSLFHSMTFLMDSIRHRKSSMLTLKRDASELALPEDSTEIEASGDGEFLPLGSPGDSSVDLSVSPASKRRKTSHLPVPPLVVSSASTPLDPRLNKSGKEGGGSSMQTSHQVTQAILKSLKALEETVQEQQRVIVDEDELFGKQVAMVMQRLNSRQKAVAKLRIQQVFLDIEFPPETPDIS